MNKQYRSCSNSSGCTQQGSNNDCSRSSNSSGLVAIADVAAYVGRHKGMEADSSNSNNQSIKGSK